MMHYINVSRLRSSMSDEMVFDGESAPGFGTRLGLGLAASLK